MMKKKIKMWILLMVACLTTNVFSQPIEISTPDQLQAIGADETSLAGEYVLVNDIDLAGYPWKAIFLFAGTFDGNGHIVKNLTTNNEENRAGGLFGKTLEGSVVKNVGVVDCNITSGWYSAALVGDCFGEVANCFAEGGTVTSITGNDVGNIGSFTGMVRASGSVTNCYSTADVTFGEPGWANQGGFVGHVAGPVTNCYYSGVVTVAGDDGLGGGFLGNGDGILTNCYFNVEVGGIAGLDSAGTTTEGGRTIDEMTQEATYVDWDFAGVWSIDEGQGYPQLLMLPPPDVQEPVTITVPNSDFETIYMPGSDTITADLGGGWTQGVGPNTLMDDGIATYSDGTTGDAVDIPGWIGVEGWEGSYDRDPNFQNRQGSVQASGVEGSYAFLANGGGWGNPNGGMVVSEAPLGNVERGTYTLSVLANGGATPVVLELLADGVALVPASSVDPELSDDWQEFSRTYDAASLEGLLGASLTIRLGVGREASGGQTRFDDVWLSFLTDAIAVPVPNGDFETLYKPGTAITGIVADGAWSMGVGPNCPIDGGTGYEFTDGTTGTSADIAGWIGYDMDGWVADGGTYDRDITNGDFQGNISFVEGNQFFGSNGGGWGNPAGGLITSAASLGTASDGDYTLSMIVRGPDGAAIPVVLDLLADGVVLAPASSVDPEVTGDWQEVSRTYDAASLAGVLGQDLTIVLGVARGSTGGQTHLDDVLLTFVPAPAGPAMVSITIDNPGFEDPVLAADDWTWLDVSGWTWLGGEGHGIWHVTSADFDPVVAPEGQNVLYNENAVGDAGGVAQVLTETFAANAGYTLTAEVGNSNFYYNGGYSVQLLAGGVVIAEDNDSLWPEYSKWATSTVEYSYDPADAALVGQPLEIRLLNLASDKDSPPADAAVGVEFDNVTLTSFLPG